MEDVYAFAIFFAVAAVFERVESYIEHLPNTRRVVRAIKHGALAVPTLHAAKDIVIHVLVYSHIAIGTS